MKPAMNVTLDPLESHGLAHRVCMSRFDGSWISMLKICTYNSYKGARQCPFRSFRGYASGVFSMFQSESALTYPETAASVICFWKRDPPRVSPFCCEFISLNRSSIPVFPSVRVPAQIPVSCSDRHSNSDASKYMTLPHAGFLSHRGTPKSSNIIGLSNITHPFFWRDTPMTMETWLKNPIQPWRLPTPQTLGSRQSAPHKRFGIPPHPSMSPAWETAQKKEHISERRRAKFLVMT